MVSANHASSNSAQSDISKETLVLRRSGGETNVCGFYQQSSDKVI